ncbi:unnamed protein product [Protopolystoma xenopodis]|uniref:Uncharacterized protein n=1 Tax=Protopolystoma xenopodis TaxID=117903 RepID=A0A3S4ZR82_9PLAT|nr:unnamed protein product [Protopolystoma xenopodis]
MFRPLNQKIWTRSANHTGQHDPHRTIQSQHQESSSTTAPLSTVTSSLFRPLNQKSWIRSANHTDQHDPHRSIQSQHQESSARFASSQLISSGQPTRDFVHQLANTILCRQTRPSTVWKIVASTTTSIPMEIQQEQNQRTLISKSHQIKSQIHEWHPSHDSTVTNHVSGLLDPLFVPDQLIGRNLSTLPIAISRQPPPNLPPLASPLFLSKRNSLSPVERNSRKTIFETPVLSHVIQGVPVSRARRSKEPAAINPHPSADRAPIIFRYTDVLVDLVNENSVSSPSASLSVSADSTEAFGGADICLSAANWLGNDAIGSSQLSKLLLPETLETLNRFAICEYRKSCHVDLYLWDIVKD